MWSAEKLLDFTLARNESQFENIIYSPGSLEFDFLAGAAGFDLTLMLPIDWAGDQLREILVDGSPIAWVAEEIKGIDYAMFTTTVAEAHIAASYAASQSTDFNKDGHVNAADLEQWQQSFGINSLADANRDGVTDGADFLIWQQQLSSAVTSTSRAVPEPTSLTLAALASLFVCLRLRPVVC